MVRYRLGDAIHMAHLRRCDVVAVVILTARDEGLEETVAQVLGGLLPSLAEPEEATPVTVVVGYADDREQTDPAYFERLLRDEGLATSGEMVCDFADVRVGGVGALSRVLVLRR
jgi:hypothetical protein